MTGTTNRSIYFYIMRLKKNKTDLDPSIVFNYINSLPFNEIGRYLKLDDAKGLSIHVDSLSSPLQFRLGTRRLGDLPDQENRGNITPVNLPPDYALFEPSHFMLYIDQIKFLNNVLGFEFNFYGPRIGKLRSYILEKAPLLVDEVELIPLMNKDFRTKIKKMGAIKKFVVGIHRDYGELLKEIDDNLPDAINMMKNVGDSEFIEITYRHERNSRKPINLPFLKNVGALERLFKHQDFIENVDTFKVKAENKYTEKVETFDLLEEYLVSKRSVVKKDEKHRSVDRDAMYYSINEAHNELRNEITSIIEKGKHA